MNQSMDQSIGHDQLMDQWMNQSMGHDQLMDQCHEYGPMEDGTMMGRPPTGRMGSMMGR